MDALICAFHKSVLKGLVVIAFIITGPFVTMGQGDVLDTELTLRYNDVSVSSILKSITRKTGYHFTYDTDLIQPERIVSVKMITEPLKSVLDTIFHDRMLSYSIIDNHIILYRALNDEAPVITEKGREPAYFISGIITDEDNGQALPYATIGIKSKAIGAVSNYEGVFNLKLSKEYMEDTLIISYLGFLSRIIPVSQAVNNHYNIKLTRKYVPIPEVIIRNRDPEELIRNARNNIPDNYGNSPANITAFYRESVLKKEKIMLYSEAVIELYKSPYTSTLLNDQVKIYKSRKINNINISDTLTFKLKSGLEGCLELDGIKNTFDFMLENSLEDYDYRMTDIVNIDDEAAFVVEFEQKETIEDMALPKGVLYINTTNYGIHGAEFSINEKYIDEIEKTMIQQTARGYRIKARSMKYRVNYIFLNGRFFLNHVRGDLEFYARKKNKLFGNAFNISFEMAVNKIDTVNVHRFSREERAPVHSIFSETISAYDREFWGTDMYVKPEESIMEALSRINARMEEYKANNSQ